jgi:3-hydroxyacyl-CoA dehydrogenase/enoyl-CoA hydratase/3-hydroxybutyryl-CoA epimerase
MNVLSESAIRELGEFGDWLAQSDVRGVVVRSGKANAFCAGADLNELNRAYDMISSAPRQSRWQQAFDHFFPISDALRKLETSGKPVAVAISGLALGGGCELTMAAHHRVITNEPRSGMGLPESLVGLLPGGGGTQRLPRLIGVEAALPILLEGKRLSGADALKVGLAHQLVAPGSEVDTAEAWILGCVDPRQPWDRSSSSTLDVAALNNIIERERSRILTKTSGHYPAPLAILTCVQNGLPKSFDEAMQIETGQFASLIQRREPRNMITALFLGRLAFDRLDKASGTPRAVRNAAEAVAGAWRADGISTTALANAGFGGVASSGRLNGWISDHSYWHESLPQTPDKIEVRSCLRNAAKLAAGFRNALSTDDRLAADYILVTELGLPAYLGGVFSTGTDGEHWSEGSAD